MLNVGLTGSVAAGKSAVAARWAEAGVPVVSADKLAREAVRPGTAGFEAVRATFGEGVVGADGSLDRDGLRSIVFSDAGKRARLESILHPIIRELRAAWIEERRAEGALLVVSEIPLLFETGVQDEFDLTVGVFAPDEERVRRMVEIRGLAEDEARRILQSQMPQEEKRYLADIDIENEGSLEGLEAQADGVLEVLRQTAGTADEEEGDGFVKMDLHLHTAGSFDCLSDPEMVLLRAFELGYERIAMTDHNRIDVALHMAAKYPDRIIPGEEVKTAEGIDVIGLYLSEEIAKGTPALETIERIREQGGIPYLPHPFAPGKGGGGKMAEELAPLCDVVEVFNARLHAPSANPRAADLAERHGKLAGAGSDAHTIGEIGNAWVELPPHENRPEALLEALAEARTGGREAPRSVHLASTWAKVRKKLPGAKRPPGASGRR